MDEKPREYSPELWVNALGMKFRLVRSGSFEMGSPKDEARRFADEEPRTTTITQDYYLALYPTTQAEWRAVVGENPSKRVGLKRAPVEYVSWYDCADFIEKLNADEYSLELRNFLGSEWRYAMPTEAQWEYACRAGTTTTYYFGNVATGKEGAFGRGASNENDSERSFARVPKAVEVGSYPPNPWGFYDMCGNVCEWTRDYYADYDQDKKVDPIGAEVSPERVARGGSWRSLPENCRSASRFNFLGTYRGDNCGLRVAIIREQI